MNALSGLANNPATAAAAMQAFQQQVFRGKFIQFMKKMTQFSLYPHKAEMVLRLNVLRAVQHDFLFPQNKLKTCFEYVSNFLNTFCALYVHIPSTIK